MVRLYNVHNTHVNVGVYFLLMSYRNENLNNFYDKMNKILNMISINGSVNAVKVSLLKNECLIHDVCKIRYDVSKFMKNAADLFNLEFQTQRRSCINQRYLWK